MGNRRVLACLVAAAMFFTAAAARADDAVPGPAARAGALLDAGRYAEAVALLEPASAAVPDDAGLLFLLGVAYGRLDRDADAVAAFERAVALDPGHAEARYDLGALYFKTGRYEAAAEAFLAIPPLHPAMTPAAHLNAGLARYRQGRIDDAVALLRRAAAEDPDGLTGTIAGRMLAFLGRSPVTEEASGPPPPGPRPDARPWSLQASVSREYDSNVLLAPDDSTITNRADARLAATLRAGLRRSVGPVRLEPEYTLYAHGYDTEDAYDFRMHRFALAAAPARRPDTFRAAYSLALTELGDRGYLDIHQVSGRLRVLARPGRAAWLEFRARINRAADSQYDYLAGHEVELIASGVTVAGGRSVYGALSARRANLGDLGDRILGPGEFRSYSYLSFSPFLRASADLGRRAKGHLDARYELRSYRDPDRWTTSVSDGRRRRDHRFTLAAELEVTLAGPVSVTAIWRGERVRSNIGNEPTDYADRDYVRNLYGGSLKVAF